MLNVEGKPEPEDKPGNESCQEQIHEEDLLHVQGRKPLQHCVLQIGQSNYLESSCFADAKRLQWQHRYPQNGNPLGCYVRSVLAEVPFAQQLRAKTVYRVWHRRGEV